MTIRVRAKARPGDCSKDVPLGPAHAERTPFGSMRMPIDEAIVYAWAKGHPVGRRS